MFRSRCRDSQDLWREFGRMIVCCCFLLFLPACVIQRSTYFSSSSQNDLFPTSSVLCNFILLWGRSKSSNLLASVVFVDQVNKTIAQPNCMSLKMIQLCYPFLLSVYNHIINTCLLDNEFPSVWKVANIVPVLKLGTNKDFKI